MTSADVDVSQLPILLSLGYVPAPATLYSGIRQLPPATILRLDLGSEPSTRAYWRPRFDGPRRDDSPRDAAGEVRRLLDQAVRRRLEADVPLGAFLSGGIDSTAVVALAKESGASDLQTITLRFEEYRGRINDEAPLAAVVAQKYGVPHTIRELSLAEFRAEPSADAVPPRFARSWRPSTK